MKSDRPLVAAYNVTKHFPVRGGLLLREVDTVKAVNGVTLEIREGETFGLVGESGCGKTTLGNILLGLERPTSGQVLFNGLDIYKTPKAERKRLRQAIQIVFQDPYESLNPRMTVGEIVSEGLRIQGGLKKAEIRRRVQEILALVGLDAKSYHRYPHEFSGGQRQRIGIARALVVQPRFIICDEPVSALDVSVQAQIINLLSDLQKQYQLTFLFIAHGLAVVRYLSDRIGVMYLGKLVEVAPAQELFDAPLHPYTRSLLAAIPDIESNTMYEAPLSGDVPSPICLPTGCTFHPRCDCRMEICARKEPEEYWTEGHMVRCHLYPHMVETPS